MLYSSQRDILLICVSRWDEKRERESIKSPSMFCIRNVLLQILVLEGSVKACPVGLYYIWWMSICVMYLCREVDDGRLCSAGKEQ